MSAAPSPENPGLLNWLLILILGVVWGSAFLSMRIALEGFTPITVAAMRVLVGSAALVVIGIIMGQGLDKVPGARGWAFASAIGLGAIALPFTLLAWGQQFVPSAYAGVAMGSVPLLVLPLVAIFSPEEGIGPRRIMGLILGFAGIAVLFDPEALSSDAVPVTDRMLIWGTAACVGAASCYAIGSIITRRAPAMPPISLATSSLVVAAIALVPLALWFEGVPDAWPTRPTLWLLYAALFPTALASVIRVRVITTAGSLFMSIVSYMVPVWSVFFGILFLSEALPPRLFAALALILAGIGIAQSRQILSALNHRRALRS